MIELADHTWATSIREAKDSMAPVHMPVPCHLRRGTKQKQFGGGHVAKPETILMSVRHAHH
jgi:hypothetical protein